MLHAIMTANSSLQELSNKLEYWQRSSELENGRNEVLRMAATGATIKETLNKLCVNAQIYDPEMLCSVLVYNDKAQTLHPIASVSLPQFYSNALEGVEVGIGVGSCGTAAFVKERVIVEDINTHPYWTQYKELALSAGLHACWSEPIIGSNGKVYGTFAMYYRQPKAPNEEDIRFIEVSANLAAVVFENEANKVQLIEANRKLTQTLDERTQELEKINKDLELSLNNQREHHVSKLYSEKVQTTKNLIVGVAHEINTPIGVALTSATHAKNQIDLLFNSIDQKAHPTSGQIHDQLEMVKEAVQINLENLKRASGLVRRFKEIDAVRYEEQNTEFEMTSFFKELKETVSDLIGPHSLEIECPSCSITLPRSALKEVLIQLIENSVLHGFKSTENGVININSVITEDELIINYQDNGCGIDSTVGQKVFEPFFVGNRVTKTMGLGLNISVNIIRQLFGGKIILKKAPVGARFEIKIPLKDKA